MYLVGERIKIGLLPIILHYPPFLIIIHGLRPPDEATPPAHLQTDPTTEREAHYVIMTVGGGDRTNLVTTTTRGIVTVPMTTIIIIGRGRGGRGNGTLVTMTTRGTAPLVTGLIEAIAHHLLLKLAT